jgi:hypothetical protein
LPDFQAPFSWHRFTYVCPSRRLYRIPLTLTAGAPFLSK